MNDVWAEEWNSFDEGWPMITDDYYVWGVNRVCIVASPQRMLVWWVLSSFVAAHDMLLCEISGSTWKSGTEPFEKEIREPRSGGNTESNNHGFRFHMLFFLGGYPKSQTPSLLHTNLKLEAYTLWDQLINIAGWKRSPEWRCMYLFPIENWRKIQPAMLVDPRGYEIFTIKFRVELRSLKLPKTSFGWIHLRTPLVAQPLQHFVQAPMAQMSATWPAWKW